VTVATAADPHAGIALRPSVAADDAFLRELYAGVRWPELASLPWTAAEKRAFCDAQFDLQDRHYRTHYPGAEFLVITAGDGAPIGRLCRVRGVGEWRLMDIALLPAHRGRGAGTRLLTELVAGADAAGVPVVLHVEHDNPARRLYERLGFAGVADPGEPGVYLEMKRPPARRRD